MAEPATVRGAEAVNVRRGPSADTHAFTSLPKGSRVTVQHVVDGWALVRLADGREGYIKATFLDLPAGVATVAPATDTPTAAPTDTAPPTLEATDEATEPTPAASAIPSPPAATPDVPATLGEEPAALEQELAELRARVAAIESAVGASGGAEPHVRFDPARDLYRDSGATQVGGALLPTPIEPERSEAAPSLAVAGVGLAIGFFFGTVYGRRQERNRRARVRF